MTNRFEGDPRIISGPDGSRFEYIDGQPVMDQGIENTILIKLGTKTKGKDSHQNGWVGNYLINDPEKRYGTDYQDTFENQPITFAGLAAMEEATRKALKCRILGDIESTVTNPETNKIVNNITVKAPQGITKFRTEFGQLWIFQASDPANEKI